VFSVPARAALEKRHDHQAAQAVNLTLEGVRIGIPKQTMAILGKIAEVDRVMRPELQATVMEVHPELCFLEMTHGRGMKNSKKRMDGRKERLAALETSGFAGLLSAWRGDLAVQRASSLDDLLDAAAACWTAQRVHSGTALCIPTKPDLDEHGLRMEMWR
jgi:predicted RNase H-like nuclease